MKIVMTLLVRDEQDILEDVLDFHLEMGVDFLIVTDNLSVDATPSILASYERAGFVRVIEERSDDYAQARWVTRMARLAATDHDADWVINGDADEFWWPTSGSIAAALAEVPSEVGALSVPRSNFVLLADEPGRYYERMVVRELRSRNALGGDLPPKLCHRGHRQVRVAQGNHAVHAPGLTTRSAAGLMEILHCPMRSFEQFENKIVKGGRAYERNSSLPPQIGSTWRNLYKLYQAGGLEAFFEATSTVDHIDPRTHVLDTRLRDYLRALRTRGCLPEVNGTVTRLDAEPNDILD